MRQLPLIVYIIPKEPALVMIKKGPVFKVLLIRLYMRWQLRQVVNNHDHDNNCNPVANKLIDPNLQDVGGVIKDADVLELQYAVNGCWEEGQP